MEKQENDMLGSHVKDDIVDVKFNGVLHREAGLNRQPVPVFLKRAHYESLLKDPDGSKGPWFLSFEKHLQAQALQEYDNVEVRNNGAFTLDYGQRPELKTRCVC
jgi:hypothetical protein